MWMLSQSFSVIIDCVISASGHGRYVVDGLNSIYKMLLFQFISTLQLMGTKMYDTQMDVHTGTLTYDVSLAS